jgi:ankyrin repeat protein
MLAMASVHQYQPGSIKFDRHATTESETPDLTVRVSLMDNRFHPAMAAIASADAGRLRALVSEDATLATSRSSTSHPTLLQCLVLGARDAPNHIEMVQILVDAGADLNEPLVACGSCNNVAAASLLLDRGAAINGTGGWSPLEEALYWHSRDVIALLIRRGASIHNLRIAAGLGRTDLIEGFFASDGRLRPEAGTISWPWGDLNTIENSNHDREGKNSLAARFASWTNDRQSVINSAFVYACMLGHIDAAALLLRKGAQLNTIPGGFDYAGSGLHYAAFNGHRPMVEFLLEQGADVNLKDTKVGGTPAGWADAGGHPEIAERLR